MIYFCGDFKSSKYDKYYMIQVILWRVLIGSKFIFFSSNITRIYVFYCHKQFLTYVILTAILIVKHFICVLVCDVQ